MAHAKPQVLRTQGGDVVFLAKVIGNVVATQKDPKFQGMKLLYIQPYINKKTSLVPSGSSVVAVDSVGAGAGECVMFTQGSSARLTLITRDAPVDCVIVGIVDSIEVDGAKVEKP
jgi:ethanolamine utilization protein EutN